jgi:enediyne polyketide synthase
VLAAAECLRRAGVTDAPLAVASQRKDAWAVFESGTLRIATLVTTLRDAHDPVVFAILTDGRT